MYPSSGVIVIPRRNMTLVGKLRVGRVERAQHAAAHRLEISIESLEHGLDDSIAKKLAYSRAVLA